MTGQILQERPEKSCCGNVALESGAGTHAFDPEHLKNKLTFCDWDYKMAPVVHVLRAWVSVDACGQERASGEL